MKTSCGNSKDLRAVDEVESLEKDVHWYNNIIFSRGKMSMQNYVFKV